MGVRIMIAIALLHLALPAQADDSSGGAGAARAKVRFELGRSHYRLGEYEQAIHEFEEGYKLSPQPLFLYNIAQSARRIGQLPKALEFYRKFLAIDPKAPERREVEQHIAEIEEAIKATPPPVPPPQIVEPPPPSAAPVVVVRHRSRPQLIAGLTLLGTSLIALSIGAGFTALAVQKNNQLSNPVPGTVFQRSVQDERNTDESVAVGMWSVGGASLIAGVALTAAGAKLR